MTGNAINIAIIYIAEILHWKFSVAKGMIVRSIKNVNNAERLVASIILLTYSLFFILSIFFYNFFLEKKITKITATIIPIIANTKRLT